MTIPMHPRKEKSPTDKRRMIVPPAEELSQSLTLFFVILHVQWSERITASFRDSKVNATPKVGFLLKICPFIEGESVA
jgi:hypothetical protein